MGEDPRAIQQQVEQTRERMGDTVEALAYKADVKTRAKDNVSQKTDKVKADDDLVMQFRIGQLETTRQSAIAILYRAAHLWEKALEGEANPDDCATFAAMTHVAVIEASLAITSQALELAGGRGMLRSSPLERYYRDVRAYSVSPPTINATMSNLGSRILAPGRLRETLVEEGV